MEQSGLYLKFTPERSISFGLLLLLIPIAVGIFLPWVDTPERSVQGYDAGGVETVAIAIAVALAILARVFRPNAAGAVLGITVLGAALVVGKTAQLWVAYAD